MNSKEMAVREYPSKKFNSIYDISLRLCYFGFSFKGLYGSSKWRLNIFHGYFLLCLIYFLYLTLTNLIKSPGAVELITLMFWPVLMFCYTYQCVIQVYQPKMVKDCRIVLEETESGRTALKSDWAKAQRRFKILCCILFIYFSIVWVTTASYLVRTIQPNILPIITGEGNLTAAFPHVYDLGYYSELTLIITDFILIFVMGVTTAGQFCWVFVYKFFIEVQVDMMTSSMQNMKKPDNNAFKLLIEEHKSLILKCENFLAVFQPLATSRLVLCGFGLTFSMFILATTDDLGPAIVLSIGDNMLYFVDLIAHCHVATVITTSLEKLGNTFYFGPWHEADRKMAKDFQMTIMRAQKQLQPKAFNGMIRIQMSTITDVLQLCYSYLTLLNRSHSARHSKS